MNAVIQPTQVYSGSKSDGSYNIERHGRCVAMVTPMPMKNHSFDPNDIKNLEKKRVSTEVEADIGN